MNGEDYTIVAVMPASFEPLVSEHFYQRAEVWALLGYDRSLPYACRTCEHLKAIARLAPDATIESATADIGGVQAALRREFPSDTRRSR